AKAEARRVYTHAWQLIRWRLLTKFGDMPAVIGLEQTEARSPRLIRRNHGDRDISPSIFVMANEVAIIHLIEMVTGKDQDVIRVEVADVHHDLAHGVGCALEPVFVLRRLLCGQNVYESIGESTEAVSARNVTIERS